jgi:hypothetical protein
MFPDTLLIILVIGGSAFAVCVAIRTAAETISDAINNAREELASEITETRACVEETSAGTEGLDRDMRKRLYS